MTRGLIRFEHTGNFHFLTFSCFHRLQQARDAGDVPEPARISDYDLTASFRMRPQGAAEMR